jgi:hypothetical protein
MVVRGKTANFRQEVDQPADQSGLISSDVAGATMFITGGQFENAGTLEGKNGGSLTSRL